MTSHTPRPAYAMFAKISSVMLLLLAVSVPAFAQNANRFQIDLLVFANNDASAVYAEQWPENLYLKYPRNWARLRRGDTGGNFELVSVPDPEFAKAAASVRLSSRYRPLLQLSWEQDLVSRRKAPAILIKGGKEYGEHKELEGYLRVAVERYLYVETNLWYSSFGQHANFSFSGDSASGDLSQAASPYYLPRQPTSYNEEPEFIDEEYESSAEYQAFLRDNPGAEPPLPGAAPLPAANSVPIDRIVVMNQLRRMRSGELHFIDHPMFGAIVKISKAGDAGRETENAKN